MQPERTIRPSAAANAAPSPTVAVLVSVGRHPVTSRSRRAEQDARAVETALALSDPAQIRLLHAGPVDAERRDALRAYLGMGLAELELIETPADGDARFALAARLRELAPQLVLCGVRAETGEGSGLLPYLLAERLGWALVAGVAAIECVDAQSATLLQALPRGQRRRLRVRLPAILTVDQAAPAARQSAFGAARRGAIRPLAVAGADTVDGEAAQWRFAPAKKRPKRLKIVKAASARDRFKAAAAKAEGGRGQVLTGLPPQAAAEAILKLLRDEGVLR